MTAGLLLWALPDVPWWGRPRGHVPVPLIVAAMLALALSQSLPFLWRRTHPAAVLSATSAVLVIRAVSGHRVESTVAATLVAAYGLGAFGGAWPQRAARCLAASSIVTALGIGLGWNSHRDAALPIALVATALLVGLSERGRRHATVLELEAAHAAERNHIARELHDVLAHQLSAITVRAGATRMTAPEASADTVDAVSFIEETARDALGELARLLGVLRRDNDDVLARQPQPGLADLADLAELVRRLQTAGIPVELHVTGTVRQVPAGVGVSAYRIIQEAPTNVARHAGPLSTRVAVDYGPDCATITVLNQKASGATRRMEPRTSGHRGLVGMKERAELFGGRVTSGPRADGGYEVCASLPYTTTGNP